MIGMLRQWGVALVVLAMSAQPLSAQPLSAQPLSAQAQAAPDAQRQALAERLMALSQGPNITKQIDAQVRQLGAESSDLTSEQRAWMTTNMTRMIRTMMDGLIEDLVDIYARTFSEEELEAQIAFYQTPVGRSIIEKSVAIGVEQARVMEEHQQTFLTDLMTKFCQRFDCSASSSGIKGD